MQTKKTLEMAEGEGRGQALAAQVMREQRSRSQAEAYAIGYEDGARAAHPLVSFAVGVVSGVITAIFYQAIAARVVAFFS